MINKKCMDDGAGVTAIAVSDDDTRMAVGHRNGKVTLWDTEFLIEPKVLKTTDFSKSTVLCLDFVSDKNDMVVASDQNGLVSLLIFKDSIFSMKCEKYGIRDS